MFFDNNANLPIADSTLDVYAEYSKIGNINSATLTAKKGDKVVREFAARVVGNIEGNTGIKFKSIYTSGGSESNSTILNHFLITKLSIGAKLNVVCSTVEHPSITEGIINLVKMKLARVVWVMPLSNGVIDPTKFISAIGQDTDLVFLQSVNSETGAVQPVELVYETTRRLGCHLHVDHVQGFCKVPAIGDSIAISFHKIGGPIGCGMLIFRNNINIIPLIYGKQNSKMRGGTYPIGSIAAAQYLYNSYTYNYTLFTRLKSEFIKQMSKYFTCITYLYFMEHIDNPKILKDNIMILFSDDRCLPHTVFFSLAKNSEVICGLLVKQKLQERGITIGNSTACNSVSDSSEYGSMKSTMILEPVKKGFIRVSFNSKHTIQSAKLLASSIANVAL